jgi:RNA polymerase sigma factor (sigma-70 family)
MKYAKQSHLAAIFEDAQSEGYLAVVEAVRSYNPAKKIHFAGYVDSRVKYAIWNFFKKNKRRWQKEIPDTATFDGEEISILELLPINDQDFSEEIAAAIELKAQISKTKKILSELSAKQQKVINLTVFKEKQLKEAAQEMGITPQAVYNLQKRGLRNLKDKLSQAAFI